MKTVTQFILTGVFAVGSAIAAEPSSKDIPPPAAMKNLRLGLWEGTIQSKRSAQAEVDMSKMDMSGFSPEEKARVEAVLKRQHAEHVAQGNTPTVKSKTKRYCLKADELTKKFSMGDEGRGHGECKESEISRTPSQIALRAECAVEGTKMVTDISYGVKSPTEAIGEIHSKGTMMGRAYESSEKIEAHWIGPDCGNVSEGPHSH